VSSHHATRSVALHNRTREAVDELRGMRCSDPAAAPALDAVRLTVHTLEQWWLPELTRLIAATPISGR
jgi:hypothetical protein